MRIYLVRHGSTIWNEKMLWQGRKNVPLSEKGKKEIRLLALRFASVPVDKIYSSPLSRAVETAKEIAKVHGLNVEILEDLIEADFSRWEGKKGSYIKENDPAYEIWSSDPDATIDGIEPVKMVHERAKRALDFIMKNGGEEIVVVSHAMLMRMIICEILKMDLRAFRNFLLFNASVTTIVEDSLGLRLEVLNDTSHLGGVNL